MERNGWWTSWRARCRSHWRTCLAQPPCGHVPMRDDQLRVPSGFELWFDAPVSGMLGEGRLTRRWTGFKTKVLVWDRVTIVKAAAAKVYFTTRIKWSCNGMPMMSSGAASPSTSLLHTEMDKWLLSVAGINLQSLATWEICVHCTSCVLCFVVRMCNTQKDSECVPIAYDICLEYSTSEAELELAQTIYQILNWRVASYCSIYMRWTGIAWCVLTDLAKTKKNA